MKPKKNLNLPKEKIAEFCLKNHIRQLSLFSSAIQDDFTRESDLSAVALKKGFR
jgi:predicted nucleotidyltransferase